MLEIPYLTPWAEPPSKWQTAVSHHWYMVLKLILIWPTGDPHGSQCVNLSYIENTWKADGLTQQTNIPPTLQWFVCILLWVNQYNNTSLDYYINKYITWSAEKASGNSIFTSSSSMWPDINECCERVHWSLAEARAGHRNGATGKADMFLMQLRHLQKECIQTGRVFNFI